MSSNTRERRQWIEPPPLDPPPALRDLVGGSALLAGHLARKGFATVSRARAFLSDARYSPASAAELPDIEPAVDRLNRAIKSRERILVWGDFDVDGQTSTALLVSALRRRGAQVDFHIPNRFTEGHGIHLPTLKGYLDGGVELLLTCDTGVAAHEAVDFANSRGVDVVITDHHALPARLPEAVAVVNPRRLPEAHPLLELPGVGVAYKLIEALPGDEDPADLLDLVALGIVADVMLQVDDTRYLLQRGLNLLRENRRAGLGAILERAQIPAAQLNEGHIGFAIGPRLNALGRLDDANPAVELLTTSDDERARFLAGRLESLNARRKFLSSQVYESAIAQIEDQPWLLDYAALVLSHPDWHPGVIGIVASRLVEEFGLPTVLIAVPDAVGRGSARSVAGVDIGVALELSAANLTRYGGHSMAAGLTLPAENIFAFRRALSRAAREMAGDAPADHSLTIDGFVGLDEVSLELARDIERLAPFGNGNPPLTLASRNLKIAGRRGLGRKGEHLQLNVEDENGNRQRVIWWRGAGRDLPRSRFDLAYTLRASVFRGQSEALVEWLDFRLADDSAPQLRTDESLEIVDRRVCRDPQAELERAWQASPENLVWAEVDQPPGAVDRLNLRQCETLIVWSSPASAEIWAAALATAEPARLVLIGAPTSQEGKTAFLRRLAALVKYAINQKGGIADLEALAAAMGEREGAIQAGLQVLRATGKLDYAVTAGGQFRLRFAAAPASHELAMRQERLELVLCESRAYRKYWTTMRIQDGDDDN